MARRLERVRETERSRVVRSWYRIGKPTEEDFARAAQFEWETVSGEEHATGDPERSGRPKVSSGS